jgi:8-oxo-dGTP diphosphatase
MIDVCCAIIEKNGKLLATRRGKNMHLSGYWEFPGGKVENHETNDNCICREIKEELNVDIEIKHELPGVEYIYPEKSIRLIPFICIIISGEIILTDHSEIKWIKPDLWNQLKWAPADIQVIEQYLEKMNRG